MEKLYMITCLHDKFKNKIKILIKSFVNNQEIIETFIKIKHFRMSKNTFRHI